MSFTSFTAPSLPGRPVAAPAVTSNEAFARYAAHRKAELGESEPMRPLTEGEKVNLKIDSTINAGGSLATAILGAPLLLLCPPAGVAVMGLAAAQMASSVADDITLSRGTTRH